MTDKIPIKKRNGHLSAVVSGRFDLIKAKILIKRLVDTGRSHNISKLFIDCREITDYVSFINRYPFFEYLFSLYPWGFRIAFVVSESRLLPDIFLMRLARDRGFRIMGTTNPENALRWLEDQPSNRGITDNSNDSGRSSISA
jgi:hypothetical protein